MIRKKHTIVWEKWEDPFAVSEDFIEYYPEEDLTEEELEEYNQLVEEGAEHLQQKASTAQHKFIVTPFGIFSPEKISIGQHFKFWIGHTNFDLSSKIVDIIEKTEGVEVLNIYTRYRFRVAIGESFSDRHIMSLINKRINQYSDQINE